jgi:hypothetical protein
VEARHTVVAAALALGAALGLGAAAFFSVVFFSVTFFSVLGSAFSFLGAAAGFASFTVPEAPRGSVREDSKQ